MGRMDKYEEKIDDSIVTTRTSKNQDMYKDVYLNNTLIDMDKVIPDISEEGHFDLDQVEVVDYEEKSYDINEYLMRAKEKRVNDNLKRSLDDTDCQVDKIAEKRDEISKLIASIEQKEKESDLFNELLPDNAENTIITDPVNETKLDSVISEEIVYNYTLEKNKINEGFNDIEDNKKTKKYSKKLPLIIFISTLVILAGVIITIIVKM